MALLKPITNRANTIEKRRENRSSLTCARVELKSNDPREMKKARERESEFKFSGVKVTF